MDAESSESATPPEEIEDGDPEPKAIKKSKVSEPDKVQSKSPKQTPEPPPEPGFIKKFQQSNASSWLGGIVLLVAVGSLFKGKKKK